MSYIPALRATGIIRVNAPDVPKDAPRPLVGETPWYSGRTLPVQIGVYKRLSIAGTVMFSLFDGDQWLWQTQTPAAAARQTSPSLCQTLPWCGLRTPPPQGYGPMVNVAGMAGISDSEGGDLC